MCSFESNQAQLYLLRQRKTNLERTIAERLRWNRGTVFPTPVTSLSKELRKVKAEIAKRS